MNQTTDNSRQEPSRGFPGSMTCGGTGGVEAVPFDLRDRDQPVRRPFLGS